jgi:inosine/xanthosine triphosphatase
MFGYVQKSLYPLKLVFIFVRKEIKMEFITQVIVASENEVKVSAVREVISQYDTLKKLLVTPCTVKTTVNEQPISLEETVIGAKKRAEHVYRKNSLSIGLESGLMLVPTSDDEYMNVCICAIFDGEKHHIGMSCGSRIPKQVSTLIIEEGLNLNQAMKQCNFTDNPKLGSCIGTIGVFTDGRITRKDYCKQCITTALISIDQSRYFIEEFCKITVTRQFNQSRDVVWDFLINHPDWHPRSQDLLSNENGSTVEIKDGTMVMQEVEEDREKYGFGYKMINCPLPFDDYHARVKVHELDEKNCAIEWTGTFKPKGVTKKEAELLATMIYEDGLKQLQEAIR